MTGGFALPEARAVAQSTGGKHAGDLVLARAACAGDPVAVDEIVTSTQRKVWQFCRHLLDTDDDAYDAAQETYIQALASLRSYRGDAALGTWLLAIARRVCSRSLRDRMKRRRSERAALDVGRDAENGLVELRMLLQQLPDDLREALVLTRLVGLSYEEAAQTMECPVGTVRSRVFRARQRLLDLQGLG